MSEIRRFRESSTPPHGTPREGWLLGNKEGQRIWREKDPWVPVKQRRKRVRFCTAEVPQASTPNVVWAVHFQFAADETAQRPEVVSIV